MADKYLNDTVTLYNYAGEKDDLPLYFRTVIGRCCLFAANGASAERTPSNSAKLFLFHEKTDFGGKQYIDSVSWQRLPDEQKEKYWTIGKTGDDYIIHGIANQSIPPDAGFKHRIVSFKELKKGRKAMWHFEVECR